MNYQQVYWNWWYHLPAGETLRLLLPTDDRLDLRPLESDLSLLLLSTLELGLDLAMLAVGGLLGAGLDVRWEAGVGTRGDLLVRRDELCMHVEIHSKY